ncbi:hypothetical protein MSPP1_001173 [Malassezia sp. CBS 17886]|nr:hypothetical protein MSPP1_001173 [Malassezia sp. CBS 17886]
MANSPAAPREHPSPQRHVASPTEGGGDALLDAEPLELPSARVPPEQPRDTPETCEEKDACSTAQRPRPHLHASPPPDTSNVRPRRTRQPSVTADGMRPAVLTVSAVLSRSGQIHPLLPAALSPNGSMEPHGEPQTDLTYLRTRRRQSADTVPAVGPGDTPDTGRPETPLGESAGAASIFEQWQNALLGVRAQGRRRTTGFESTGSAFEALGALFLGRDSAGRLEQLSLRRERQSTHSSTLDALPFWLRVAEARKLVLCVQDWHVRFRAWLSEHRTPRPHAPPAAPRSTEQRADLWDLPPTPVAMPGAFVHDGDAVLLPPPLLDDCGSDPRSFEGLLGIRRMREQQEQKQYLDRLRERNRPLRRAGPLVALVDFVRAANASERMGMEWKWNRRRFAAPHSNTDAPIRTSVQWAMAAGGVTRAWNVSSLFAQTVPQAGAPWRTGEGGGGGAVLNRTQEAHGAEDDAAHTPDKGQRPSPAGVARPCNSPWSADTHLGTAWIVISCVMVGVTFLPDFFVFVLAHVLDALLVVHECITQGVWFVWWTWQNITGQTVLGRVGIEAYVLIQSEWACVAREDHEARAERRPSLLRVRRRQGLSALQVVRGFMELVCLQAVTRAQYEREGAGLVRIADACRTRDAMPPAEDEDAAMLVTDRWNDIIALARTPSTMDGHDADAAPHAGAGGAADVSARMRTQESAFVWSAEPAAFVRTMRWASQLAMSAYGLHVLVMDLPPQFTPSGRQTSQQTFAYLSRLDARDVLHADIQALGADAAYSPTFYIVRDMQRKVVCVAVRGTQSFADIVVDLDMRTDDVTAHLSEWRGVEMSHDAERFSCHAGIWRAARAMVAPDSTLFRKLCDTLREHADFGVVFVGHSLGGALASAVSILLSEYHLDDADARDPAAGCWRTTGLHGFPAGRPIRAFTFAHPSTLSANLSRRIAYGRVPLVASVVLDSDIIPRFGHGQVRELRRVLGALTRVRRRRRRVSVAAKDRRGGDPEEATAVVPILRRFCDWVFLCRTERPDAVMRDRRRRIEEQFWRLRCEVEDDLYSRAKRRFDDAQVDGSGMLASPWLRAHERGGVPLHTLSARRRRLDDATLSSETAQGGPLVPGGRCLWLARGALYDITDPMAFFSLPDFEASMFANHFPAAYEEAIRALGRRSDSEP